VPSAAPPIGVDSLDDPRLDDFRNVKEARLREASGLFLVEGRKNVDVLVRSGRFDPKSVFVTQTAFEAMAATWAALPARVPVYVGSAAMLEGVIGFDLHRGCLAAAHRRREAGLREILGTRGTIVAAEDLTDAENVGSLFRNALALGAGGVLLSPRCCDPLYRKAVRVSMGAVLRLPFARASQWPDELDELRAAGCTVVALDPAPEAEQVDAFAARAAHAAGSGAGAGAETGRLVLLVGTEGAGLSRGALERSCARVRIPMAAGVDSLNVATAAAIALHRLASLPASGPS